MSFIRGKRLCLLSILIQDEGLQKDWSEMRGQHILQLVRHLLVNDSNHSSDNVPLSENLLEYDCILNDCKESPQGRCLSKLKHRLPLTNQQCHRLVINRNYSRL